MNVPHSCFSLVSLLTTETPELAKASVIPLRSMEYCPFISADELNLQTFSLAHDSFPPSPDIMQSVEHTELKTPAAGLNSHFHPCSCANTTAAAGSLHKLLQCRYVPKGREKPPARISMVNRYQQAATAQLASR